MPNGDGNVKGEIVILQISLELPSWHLQITRNTDNVIIMRGMCDEAIELAKAQIAAQRRIEAEKEKIKQEQEKRIILPEPVLMRKKK